MVDVIARKRDGDALTADEIRYVVAQASRPDAPDAQLAALLMAIVWRGMDDAETLALTEAMAASGEMLDLREVVGYAVDKHSTGGVGDKTSLVVLPLVAAAGVPVAKMSGRGLGFTGGTLDKLESIPGFDVNVPPQRFREQVRAVGLVLAGQSAVLAPADGKLYALRDITGTVASMPLIASSIMSKKLAAGAHGIVLDVKVGRGAFMPDVPRARALAELLVAIGVGAGRDVVALISEMGQPLGAAVGNALEVAEAIAALRGGGPADLREHCLVIAGQMLRLAGQGARWADVDATRADLEALLADGRALALFRAMVAAQGGDASVVDDPDQLPRAPIVVDVPAPRGGVVAQVAADSIGLAAMRLGAGRARKEDTIDHSVGVVVHVKVGDEVAEGAPLAQVHARTQAAADEALATLHDVIVVGGAPVARLPLFYGVVEGLAGRNAPSAS